MADSLKHLQLLALGPQDVFPPVDGGKEGIFGALAALACHADVTYAYPSSSGNPGEGYARIGVTALPIPVLPEEKLSTILLATLAGKPYKFEKYGTAAAARALDAALPGKSFSAIVCHHAHMVGLAERFLKLRGLRLPIIVREHNIEYSLVESYRDSLRGLKRVAASLFVSLTRREELRIWHNADAIAFLSDQDLRSAQAAAATVARGRLFLAREGVPTPPRRPVYYPGVGAPLLVLLNPAAAQSVYNLRDFVHQYWLALRAKGRLSNDELHVTGVTDERLADLLEISISDLHHAGIFGLGFLPSLAATLEGALALVSPTFVGGGIRKKVLEAMANQLPVIATELDIACCDYFQPTVNILSMGDPDQFADTVQRLRQDPGRWEALSANARNTVEEFASWEHYGSVMVQVIKGLVAADRC